MNDLNKKPAILVLDEGTTSTKAVAFDKDGQVVDFESQPLNIQTAADGSVEQDATEIWAKTRVVLGTVVERVRRAGYQIQALAITSQRSSTVLWDRKTGHPVAPMFSWQDTRVWSDAGQALADWGDSFRSVTGGQLGLAAGPFHLRWILSRDPELLRRAEAGELLAGSPETWLIWNLTGGPTGGTYATSLSCGSAFAPVRLDDLDYWGEFLDYMKVPRNLMPELRPDDANFGLTRTNLIGIEVPIIGVIGDQQAALFGQGCFEPGAVKATHGTGSFINYNVGAVPHPTENIDMRVGWQEGDNTTYMLEASIPVTGSGVDWLVDGIGMMEKTSLVDVAYAEGDPHSGVIIVPSLAGLAAPYYDSDTRGTFFGVNRGTTKGDIVRATVDGIAHLVVDALDKIAESTGVRPTKVEADGGLSRSDSLLQMQADLLQVPVVRAADSEFVTARGAAWLSGIATGLWDSHDDAKQTAEVGWVFTPQMDPAERDARRAAWADAVNRTLAWKRTELQEQAPQ